MVGSEDVWQDITSRSKQRLEFGDFSGVCCAICTIAIRDQLLVTSITNNQIIINMFTFNLGLCYLLCHFQGGD